MKVSPSIAHRMIDAAKLALRDYIADVYITVDQRKGTAGGKQVFDETLVIFSKILTYSEKTQRNIIAFIK